MSTPDVTTHTCHAIISHLASPDCHPRPTPCGFFLSSDPHCATPSDCTSGRKTTEAGYLPCLRCHGALRYTGGEMGHQSHRCQWGIQRIRQAPGHLS